MLGNVAKSFEELHIYQRARELTNAVYAITREGAFARDFGLVNQLRRAVVSVMSNIVEGFERGNLGQDEGMHRSAASPHCPRTFRKSKTPG